VLLLEKGADQAARDIYGGIAVDAAARREHKEVVKLLAIPNFKYFFGEKNSRAAPNRGPCRTTRKTRVVGW